MEPPIVKLIQAIPDVVWAAVAASVITLLGVFLTNRDSRKRLEIQLDHDAQQRDREREMEIRREVYLAGAEAVAEAQERLGSFASLDIREVGKNFSGTSLSPAINKVLLIGSEPTVRSVNAFTRKYGEVVLGLMAKKIRLAKVQSEIQNLDQRIEETLKYRDELRQEMQSISQTTKNSTLVERLNATFEQSEKTVNAQMMAREKKQALATTLYFELTNESLEASFETGEHLVEANLAVRRELDLPIDEEFYRKLTTEGRQAVREAFKRYLRDLQEPTAESKV